MYERQQQAWGFVPNYAKVFSHRPEVLARWARLLAEIRRPMDARRFELITFAAAHTLRHTACSLVHGQALTQFFGEEEVRDLALGKVSESFTEGEKAMMEFSRKVAADASKITSGDVDVLRTHGAEELNLHHILVVKSPDQPR